MLIFQKKHAKWSVLNFIFQVISLLIPITQNSAKRSITAKILGHKSTFRLGIWSIPFQKRFPASLSPNVVPQESRSHHHGSLNSFLKAANSVSAVSTLTLVSHILDIEKGPLLPWEQHLPVADLLFPSFPWPENTNSRSFFLSDMIESHSMLKSIGMVWSYLRKPLSCAPVRI